MYTVQCGSVHTCNNQKKSKEAYFCSCLHDVIWGGGRCRVCLRASNWGGGQDSAISKIDSAGFFNGKLGFFNISTFKIFYFFGC